MNFPFAFATCEHWENRKTNICSAFDSIRCPIPTTIIAVELQLIRQSQQTIASEESERERKELGIFVPDWTQFPWINSSLNSNQIHELFQSVSCISFHYRMFLIECDYNSLSLDLRTLFAGFIVKSI